MKFSLHSSRPASHLIYSLCGKDQQTGSSNLFEFKRLHQPAKPLPSTESQSDWLCKFLTLPKQSLIGSAFSAELKSWLTHNQFFAVNVPVKICCVESEEFKPNKAHPDAQCQLAGRTPNRLLLSSITAPRRVTDGERLSQRWLSSTVNFAAGEVGS